MFIKKVHNDNAISLQKPIVAGGGLTALACEGDFIEGAAQGTITYLANHLAHRLESQKNNGGGDPPKKGKASSGGGERSGLNKAQIGMESVGAANTSKIKVIDYAAKADPTIDKLKYVKSVKVVGKGIAVAGAIATAYETGNDIANRHYYSAATRIAVYSVAAGSIAIPFVGWGVSAGIGLADAIWGDQFYNWVESNVGK